jgi:hypothetical protein
MEWKSRNKGFFVCAIAAYPAPPHRMVSGYRAAPTGADHSAFTCRGTPSIDHIAIDLKGHRLFVAALGNNTLEIVGLTTGKQSRSIRALAEPQGCSIFPAPIQSV